MTADETIALIERLKSMGAKKVKVDGCEVEFADHADTDLVSAMDQIEQQVRTEILGKLAPDARAKLEEREDEALKYGSS